MVVISYETSEISEGLVLCNATLLPANRKQRSITLLFPKLFQT